MHHRNWAVADNPSYLEHSPLTDGWDIFRKEIEMTTKKDVARQRRVQKEVDGRDASKGSGGSKPPMQAGAREYPVPPFPKQHQPKPGDERRLE